MKIYTVGNHKGGTGKSVVAVNFAAGAALANPDLQVLQIDMDPQAHATRGLGVEPSNDIDSMYNVYMHETPLYEVARETGNVEEENYEKRRIKNLYIAPSYILMKNVPKYFTEQAARRNRGPYADPIPEDSAENMDFLLNKINEMDVDIVVIDTPPNLEMLTQHAIYAADYVIVPCNTGKKSLDGFSELEDEIDRMNNKERTVKIVLNQYDSRRTIENEYTMEQLEGYESMLLNTKIRNSSALVHSDIFTEPVLRLRPSGISAQDFKNLTQEILNG